MERRDSSANAVLRVTRGHGQGGWVPACGGQREGEGHPRGAPLRGKGECGGWREWRTVMGWRGVECGAVRFLAEPRNDRGRYRMVRRQGVGWGEGRPRGTPLRGEGGVRWAVGMAHRNGMEWRWAGGDEIVRGASEWHWGRGGKMGPRMREDKGGVFTPILTFPRRGAHGGRPCGGRGVRWTVGMAHSTGMEGR